MATEKKGFKGKIRAEAMTNYLRDDQKYKLVTPMNTKSDLD